jgi:DNA helicase-2/ATP-dependent DNA helicase PcrA
LHEEEERRLFYVAMTRARDSLTLLSRPSGKKTPKLGGYPADILSAAGAHASTRSTREVTVDLHAAADALVRPPGEWLTRPLTPAAHPVLSASAIEDYKACPLRYKIAREWNLRAGAGAPMQFGAAMHTALKAHGDALCSGRATDAESIIACFRAELEKAALPDKVQRSLYEKLGERQLRAFMKARTETPADEVMNSERSFEHLIGKVRVRGRVDRLDRLEGGGVAIIDYKTGAPRSQDDADKSLQLSLYAIAAREAWGLVPERLVFYNLETNAAVSTTRSEKELQEARQTVEDVAQNIAQGMFDADPGYHCRKCPYNSVCPETEQRLLSLSDFIPGAPKENA